MVFRHGSQVIGKSAHRENGARRGRVRSYFVLYQVQDPGAVSGVGFRPNRQTALSIDPNPLKVWIKRPTKADYVANLNSIYNLVNADAVAVAFAIAGGDFSVEKPSDN